MLHKIKQKLQWLLQLQVCKKDYENLIAILNKKIEHKDEEIFNLKLQNATYERKIESIEEDLKYKETLINRLRTTQRKEYEIEEPKIWLNELKEKIKMADDRTIKLIIEFLKLDTFERIKNIALIAKMRGNGMQEAIAYIDWIITSNEMLKQVLQTKIEDKSYIDPLTWEKRIKKNKKF